MFMTPVCRGVRHVWKLGKALYSPGLGEQSGVLKDSMIKEYLLYRNIHEKLKLLKDKMN